MASVEKQIEYRKWYNKRQKEILTKGITLKITVQQVGYEFAAAREGHEEELGFVYPDNGEAAQQQISDYVYDVLAEEKKAKRKELFG